MPSIITAHSMKLTITAVNARWQYNITRGNGFATGYNINNWFLRGDVEDEDK